MLLDAVGTVIEPRPAAGVVYSEHARRFGLERSPAEVARRFGPAFMAQRRIDEAAGHVVSEVRELARWRTIVAEIFPECAQPEELFQGLWGHFSSAGGWECCPDTAPAVERLNASGVRWGIASNFDSRLREIVAELPELAGCGFLAISSEVGFQKPSPRFFEAVLKAEGAAPAETLLLGDDPHNDVSGALAAGLHTARIDRRLPPSLDEEPTPRFADLESALDHFGVG